MSKSEVYQIKDVDTLNWNEWSRSKEIDRIDCCHDSSTYCISETEVEKFGIPRSVYVVAVNA